MFRFSFQSARLQHRIISAGVNFKETMLGL
jgi:hypothetical protein